MSDMKHYECIERYNVLYKCIEHYNIHFPHQWKLFYNKQILQGKIIHANQVNYREMLPFQQWTIIPLVHILKQIHALDTSHHYVDIAIKPIANESYMICSMMNDGNTFFLRKEGGMNGIDRYFNKEHYDQYILKDIINLLDNNNITYK